MSNQESLNTLIGLHLDGQLSADQADRLASLLKDSDDAAAQFWCAVHLHHAAVELADRQWGQISGAEDNGEVNAPDSINSVFPAPFSFEEQAKQNNKQVGFKEVVSILGYQFKQTAGKHRAALAAAALFTIVGLISIVLLLTIPRNDSTQPIAFDDPGEKDTPGITPIIVATLTAEHDAAWDRRPGQDLHAGQRLTLTAGIAEITTNGGAIAVIQAPSTIELLNNDNAIRLHTGKLMGICETESSKGFLVRTPQMDVIDQGTRFGVEASPLSGATEVHVLEGEVEAAVTSGNAGSTTRLIAGQSARALANTDTITAIDHDPERFVPLMLNLIRLPGTGSGVASGDTDSKWQIIAINGQELSAPLHPRVAPDNSFHLKTVPSDPSIAQWILFETSGRYRDGDGDRSYTFQTQIDVPAAIDPASVALILQFAADALLSEVQINGHTIAAPKNALPPENGVMGKMLIKDQLRQGQNTIRFIVRDDYVPAPHTNNVGLIVAWQLDTDASRLERPKR